MSVKKGLRALSGMSSSGRGDAYRFSLADGETAVVRFIGDFEGEQDPVVGYVHYIKSAPIGKQYQNCGDNAPEGTHAGCVFCANKQKRSPRAVFYLKDMRLTHVLDQEVRVPKPGVVVVPGRPLSEDSYMTTKYPPCRRQNCQYCKQGNEARPKGFRTWEMAGQFADQVTVLQATLRDYCKCGARGSEGEGTIYVWTYGCGNAECGVEVQFSPDRGQLTAHCDTCGQTTVPVEYVRCSACDAAEQGDSEITPVHTRCDLPDFLIRVSRSGEKMRTSYNFEPVHPCRPMTDEEAAEVAEKRPDLEAMLAPEPSEMQAATLGVRSPFATAGHGARPYTEAPAEEPATDDDVVY